MPGCVDNVAVASRQSTNKTENCYETVLTKLLQSTSLEREDAHFQRVSVQPGGQT